MQKYITQLLTDIAAIKQQREKERERRNDASSYIDEENMYEDMFAEVERYVSEDPKETLGDHCGLLKVQFPKADKLTEKQCAILAEALDKLYFAFNVDANIPHGLPVRVAYSALVELLDKRVFLDWFGTTTFEHCGYDYEGLCPFKQDSCACSLEWASGLAMLIEKPESEWTSMEAMEVFWYELMSRFKWLKLDFEQVMTPNKAVVEKLLLQLE